MQTELTAAEKLSGLRSFLAGYSLSDSARRNHLGGTIDKWIDGLDALLAAPRATPAPDDEKPSVREAIAQALAEKLAEWSEPGGAVTFDAFGSRHIDELTDAVIAAAPPATPAAAGLRECQEPKYTVNGSAIVNRMSGEAIPPDEPVFIFRARDKKAIQAISFYAERCLGNHYAAVRKRIKHFRQFQSRHPDRMKDPDTAAAPATPGGSAA